MNFLYSLGKALWGGHTDVDPPNIPPSDEVRDQVLLNSDLLEKIIGYANANVRSEGLGLTQRDLLVCKAWQGSAFALLQKRALANGIEAWSQECHVQIHPIAMAILLRKINLAQMKDCLGIYRAVDLMNSCFGNLQFLADPNKTRHVLSYTEAEYSYPKDSLVLFPIWPFGIKMRASIGLYLDRNDRNLEPNPQDSTEETQEKTRRLHRFMHITYPYQKILEYWDIPGRTPRQLLLPPVILLTKVNKQRFLCFERGGVQTRPDFPLRLDDEYFYMQHPYAKHVRLRGLDCTVVPKCFGYLPKLKSISLHNLSQLQSIPEDFPIPSNFGSLKIEQCPLLRIVPKLQQRLRENNVAVLWADATDEQRLEIYRL